MAVFMYNSVCAVFSVSCNVKMIKGFIRSEITEDSAKLRRNPAPRSQCRMDFSEGNLSPM